ncbi:serine hydrolase [Deinococcus maricopensis]|uniref:Beta-lactamase n=1 Tax=Deinococcus maricopensis (strain DSM 21211 / LMG 22137 / NRRL B-23946 / LB-34) TaxID=709986 RepID=E8U6Q1_DEIML|nr:serine hydrolase [Deinococcus maricopensis]ADV66740.1 beta-lactamase [Deinococcus maricopensis DSM 21211]
MARLTGGAAFLAAVRARGFPGVAALVVEDLHRGERLVELQGARAFPAASTIKVPLLVHALQRVQAGALNLGARVPVPADARVPGAGVLHELDGGLAPTVRDLLTLMIVVSDNTATNLVIDLLGEAAFNAWLQAEGLRGTHLVGPLQRPPHLQNPAQRRGERNRTCADDQVTLLSRLARGELLNPELTALALDVLSRQQVRPILARHLPYTVDGTLSVRVASKSGELRGVRHDVGVVWLPRPLVVAVLSEGGADAREHPDNTDERALAGALWPVLDALGHTVPGDILPE